MQNLSWGILVLALLSQLFADPSRGLPPQSVEASPQAATPADAKSAPPADDKSAPPADAKTPSRAPDGEPDKGGDKSKVDSAKGPQSARRFASVEELAAGVRQSIVVVSFLGRSGKPVGLGTGFVISSDGIIATNLHVIGEARPIEVRLADGQVHKVQSVHASDPTMDLALLKIDAKGLAALELGDSDKLKQGQQVVAIGNPKGLKYSVVSGVVSGRRELDGRPMLQLAIPIEEGNSGGPVLDLDGRVCGIVTLKSLVTRNLGYAVAINALKKLITRPNPVPMSRWLTVGLLDPKRWTTVGDAEWNQRAGRLRVSGQSGGFGGRALCLSSKKTPTDAFALAVDVKLSDESGAAGLVFHSNGGDKHYGFYPTNGQLRLTRFDGPTVFSWNVLSTVRTRHYRPGEWNTLRVRLAANKIQCFVNGQMVIESNDGLYGDGRVGLAKFRDTQAEFKRFRFGADLETDLPKPDVIAQILDMTASMPTDRPPSSELVRSILEREHRSSRVLQRQARKLEKTARRLRELAAGIQLKSVQQEILKGLSQKEDDIDLLRLALLVARIDNPELEIETYVADVARIVEAIQDKLPDKADDRQRVQAVDQHLFQNLGFHGSRTLYYHRSNSYLNEVIDDREGLPISLSVLYIAIAARLDVKVVGIGLPGHFVVRCEPKQGEGFLIDVFDRGKRMTRQQAEELAVNNTQAPFRNEYLEPQSKQAIVVRMLRNLQGVAIRSEDRESLLRYVDTLVLLEPDVGEHKWMRAVLYLQTGRIDESIADADWILEHQPAGIDRTRVLELRRHLQTLK